MFLGCSELKSGKARKLQSGARRLIAPPASMALSFVAPASGTAYGREGRLTLKPIRIGQPPAGESPIGIENWSSRTQNPWRTRGPDRLPHRLWNEAAPMAASMPFQGRGGKAGLSQAVRTTPQARNCTNKRSGEASGFDEPRAAAEPGTKRGRLGWRGVGFERTMTSRNRTGCKRKSGLMAGLERPKCWYGRPIARILWRGGNPHGSAIDGTLVPPHSATG
jgi:hypothetical protein